MISLLRNAKTGLEKGLNAANDLIVRLETSNAELEHQVSASNKKVSLPEAANVRLGNQIDASNYKIDRLEEENSEQEKQISALKDQVAILEICNQCGSQTDNRRKQNWIDYVESSECTCRKRVPLCRMGDS
jgi:predicted RNase H-like nuclease (RuvC/YqgF family)